MSRYHSYLNSAETVIKNYHGTEPFHLFLKKYFSADKKYGSRDRREIASLCYNYFRLGKSSVDFPIQERIVLGTFLCETKNSELLKVMKPEWNDLVEKSLNEKLSILNFPFSINDIFPYQEELSSGIDEIEFAHSFLTQPDLFLRIRPGNKKRVSGKLSGAGIHYRLLSDDCVALPNSSKVDSVIELDKEAVIQDFNSQKVGEFIKMSIPKVTGTKLSTPKIWDCCAASGGKSIMAYDISPSIQLTVSDKREAILKNLYKRFDKAGIKNYKAFVADLSTSETLFEKDSQAAASVPAASEPLKDSQVARSAPAGFDLVIADVPCTGSGTWARTPEQLYFFKKEKIEEYSTLQKNILKNVIPHLKKNGYLLYITCSVFKKENEEIVKFITGNSNLKVQKTEVLKGYDMKADTMFVALLKG